MSKLMEIDALCFQIQAVRRWINQWFLLTAGTLDDFNTMTIAWGSFGGMWGKPFAQVVVRPSRHTLKFLEKYDTFTICGFPQDYRQDLMTLGTKSGRDGNKIKETSLTPAPSHSIEAPGFKQAELIVECRKIYWQDMEPANFLNPRTKEQYPQKDYHRIFWGEIEAIFGTAEYCS
jgi:flavin reductase (DIM6/NTAB) family NADH-FMN oxidoreductase RutF